MALLIFGVVGVTDSNAAATEPAELHLPLAEGAIHGFPVLRDAQGRKLADAEFTQIPEGDRLRVKLSYDFGDRHRIEETALVRQRPALVEEEWSWAEIREGETVRHFSMNFLSGKATAEKKESTGRKFWETRLRFEPGRTFAGFAFTLALECLRDRLVQGEKIELHAIGFNPQPRLVAVEITFGGLEQMMMGSRRVAGERFVIHPKIPWIAKPFVAAPDTRIWLIHPAPAGFLRWEGPLAEPGEEMMRVDVLPGDPSGPAEPISNSNIRADVTSVGTRAVECNGPVTLKSVAKRYRR